MAVQKTISAITIAEDQDGNTTVNVAYDDGIGQAFPADAETIGSDLSTAEQSHAFEHGINRVKALYVATQAAMIANGTYTVAALQNALAQELHGKTVHVDFNNNSISSIY